jgi:hypothetical protein
VSTAEGVATYRPDDLRRLLAWVTLVVSILGAAMLAFMRRAKS